MHAISRRVLFPTTLAVAQHVHASLRFASTIADKAKFTVLVVGGGSGGLTAATQIYNRFKAAGTPLDKGDVAIVDAAENHYYQPGWTLVGSGLKPKSDFTRSLAFLIPSHITHIPESVRSFSPHSSSVTTTSGREVGYDVLVVAAGLQINWNGIEGLSKALIDSSSNVTSIYSEKTCDKTWDAIEWLHGGKAIFTQPAGIIKCAGAPQKIMWMAWDRFRRTGRGDKIDVAFYNGMPTMFSVKKYSDALDALRKERGIDGRFQHNLTSIDARNRKATFKKADGSTVDANYDLLHVVPPMGPLEVFKGSPIADQAGWVAVDPATLQHVKPEYANIFALGDCSSLPTSKTAAAITGQAPVLTENLFTFLDSGKVGRAKYDGYTSCPLLTGYGELMLAEFKYGLEPMESFANFFDQSERSRVFYHFKKDIFPAAYWNYMLKGEWFGPRTIFRPSY